MEGVLVDGQGTLEQIIDPTNAHVGPRDELATHLVVYSSSVRCVCPQKGIKKLRRPIY